MSDDTSPAPPSTPDSPAATPAVPVWRRPVPPLVQWVLLVLIAAILLSLVESGVVESPYNAF